MAFIGFNLNSAKNNFYDRLFVDTTKTILASTGKILLMQGTYPTQQEVNFATANFRQSDILAEWTSDKLQVDIDANNIITVKGTYVYATASGTATWIMFTDNYTTITSHIMVFSVSPIGGNGDVVLDNVNVSVNDVMNLRIKLSAPKFQQYYTW